MGIFSPFLQLVKIIKNRTKDVKQMKRYRRIIYTFENAIEVHEYLDGRYGARGSPRKKKKKATPEEMDKRNQWNREKLCRHRLWMYFQESHDKFVELTYDKKERPASMEVAKDHFKKFIREVRKEFRKRGYEVYWIRNIEVGTRNAWHVHMAINRIPDIDLILDKAWPYGQVTPKTMYKVGSPAKLASYLTKTPKTEPRLKESNYSTSRNMPLPEPEKETFYRMREPKEKEGFYIEKETFYEAKNKYTGYLYRHYTYIRLHRRI